MCPGNFAEASSNYINAQLAALWDNAQKCSEGEGLGKKPTDVAVKHAIALREFYGPDTKDGKSSFHAVFKKAPSLEFVCNHELLLSLFIETGQYEASKSTVDICDAVTLAIRLSYNVQEFTASLNGCPAYISILGIEPPSATLVCDKSTVQSKIDLTALFSLVKSHYLPTLVQSGSIHLLVLSPSHSPRPFIDRSVSIKSVASRDVLFGVEVDKINDVLAHHWISAVGQCRRNQQPSEEVFPQSYLAEYRTWWNSTEGKLWARLDVYPLRIQILCEKEVILYIKANVHLFESETEVDEKRDSSYEKWELAIVFQVVKHQDSILLDRSIAPRILPDLCSLPGSADPKLNQLPESLPEFQAIFKDIILCKYIDLIFKHHHHQLYPDFTSSHGIRPHPSKPSDPCKCGEPHGHGRHCVCGHYPHGGPKPDPVGWPPVRPEQPRFGVGDFSVTWAELRPLIIPETLLYDYHSITTVTQAGLNAHFAAVWKTASASGPDNKFALLARFSSKGTKATDSAASLPHFDANFGPPQIELITVSGENSVFFYFHIQKIVFFLKDETKHEFKDWLLAFKFRLKLEDLVLSSDLTDNSGLGKLHQLVLDSKTAKLAHDRSSFVGLADTKSPDVTRSLYGKFEETFVSRYMTAFVAARHHILYTIPVHSHQQMLEKPGTHSKAHAVTKLDFSIVPFSLSPFKGRTFQGLCGSTHHIVERNMIVFYGLIGDGKLEYRLKPGPYGVRFQRPSHGSLLLSRHSFLESHLLKPLANVNALTTILCKFGSVEKTTWTLSLGVWSKLRDVSEDDCQWSNPYMSEEGELTYKWVDTEEWNYEGGKNGIRVGKYTVKVKTSNHLRIPTLNEDGPLTIRVDGRCTVDLDFTASEFKHWSGCLNATWEIPIAFTSDPVKGLCITAKNAKVDFKEPEMHSNTLFDIGKQTLKNVDADLRTALGGPIDVSDSVQRLNASFSQVYQGLRCSHTDLVLAHPIFSERGDLFLQLLPKKEESTSGETLKPGQVSEPVKTDRRARREALAAKAITSPPVITTTTSEPSARPTIVTSGPATNPSGPLSSFPATSVSDTLVPNSPANFKDKLSGINLSPDLVAKITRDGGGFPERKIEEKDEAIEAAPLVSTG